MKKWLAFTLVLALVATLVMGCGSTKTKSAVGETEAVTETAASGKENEAVTLDIFQSKVEVIDQLQSLVDDFMVEYPHITVNLDTSGGGEDYLSLLKSRMNSGNQPAIFQIPGPTERDLWIDYLADLSDEEWISVTADGLLDNVTVGDKILGQPVNIEGYGIMYNRTILNAAGITDEMIKNTDTLSELRVLFETVDSQKTDLGLDTTFSWSVGGTAWWVAAYHTFNVPFAMQSDPMAFIENLNNDTENFVGNDRMDAFKNLVDLFTEFTFEDVAIVDYEKQYTTFAMSKAAFMQQGNWTINQINEIDDTLDIAFLPIPLNDDTSWNNGSIPVGVPNYWTVNSQKEDATVEASKLFLNYMAMSERGHKFITDDAKYIPAFTNVNVENSDPLAKSIISYASEGKTIPWVWHAFPSGMNENDAKKAFQDYATGEKNWNEVLEFLDAKWDEKSNN